MNIGDIIAQVFWFGILATPLLAFVIVRKSQSLSFAGKFLVGLLITLILAVIFYFIAIGIAFRDGLGPG